jgi:sortase A
MARVSGSSGQGGREDDEPGAGTTVLAESSGLTGRTQREQSPLTLVGIALLVAGLACLGWVGFQYLGTNAVSERAFTTETEQLRARWQDQDQDKADSQGRDQASEVPGEAIALLRIPAFGSDYEIPVLNGTDLAILAKGVGHYASTAAPGQIGNFAVAGHRVTHGQPFAELLTLKKGDEVIVETREAVYTYVLDESPRRLTVKDSETWVLEPVPGRPDAKPTEALITLTTCQDLFRSPDRSVGFGHLQSTQTK